MTIEAESPKERRDLLERIAWLAAAVERHAEAAGEEIPEETRAKAWASIREQVEMARAKEADNEV